VPATPQKLSVIYLGKRGGGLNLLADTLAELRKMDFSVKTYVSSNSKFEGMELLLIGESYRLFSPSSFSGFFNVNEIFKGIHGALKFISGNAEQKVLFIMPSPFDFSYYILAKIKRLDVITCIHDAVPHSGDAWPTLSSISFRLRCSSTLVVFSEHVANQLRLKTIKPILLADLPQSISQTGQLKPDALATLKKMYEFKEPVVLLIGRLKDYKNVRQIFQIAQIMDGALFVVAGSSSRPIVHSGGLLVLNRWLSNREFNAILEAADILVFPYTDASQSGTIPPAMKMGKIIVSVNHPGLLGQLKGYDRTIISEDTSAESMHIAIKKGMAMTRLKPKGDQKVVTSMRVLQYSSLAIVVTRYLFPKR